MLTKRPPSHWQVVWNSIFRRKGKPGLHTNSFEMLDLNDRAQIEAALSAMNVDEIRVLASVPSESAWCLLTTSRLVIWNKTEGKCEISVEDIREATIDLEKMASMGLTKERFNTIHITSIEGKNYYLHVEPGAPCIGLLSVLKQIARRNRSSSI